MKAFSLSPLRYVRRLSLAGIACALLVVAPRLLTRVTGQQLAATPSPQNGRALDSPTTLGDLFAKLGEVSSLPIVVLSSSSLPRGRRVPPLWDVDREAEDTTGYLSKAALLATPLADARLEGLKRDLEFNGYTTKSVVLPSGRQILSVHRLPRFTGPDLRYAQGGWLVWSTNHQFGDPRRRAIPYRTVYFRQRIGQSTVNKVFEMSGTYNRDVAAVLKDGSVIFSYLGRFETGTPQGDTMPFAGKGTDLPAIRVFSDGLLVENSAGEEVSYSFVLFDDGKPDLSTAIRLEACSGLPRVSYSTRVLKTAHRLSWSRFVFDLKTGSAQEFPVIANLTALGRNTVAYHGRLRSGSERHCARVFSLEDGRELPAHPDWPIVFLRDGVGYSTWRKSSTHRACVLRAYDLSFSEVRSADVLKFRVAASTPRYLEPATPLMETDAGLVVFAGNSRWLVRWPRLPL